jgi:DNA-binding FadR family transcriptional regulator
MLEKYQTGRGTLREALRLLEFQGVITLKPGPRGGPVLRSPDGAHLASTIVLLMQMQQGPLRAILEVRTAMEPIIIGNAADRISNESLDELKRTIVQMRENIDDRHLFADANKRFHHIIAWSSGNALYGYIIDSLLEIVDGTVLAVASPGQRRTAILKAHDEVLKALVSRDPEASQARMREHLEAYQRHAGRMFPEALAETIPWDSRFHA